MAFRILNKELKIDIPLYPKVERELATVKKKSKTVVGGFELRHKVDYMPQPGLQEDVCASECNLIFMCGQGTAGKTFALYFKALGGCDKKDFTARIISYQAKDSKKGSSMLRDGIKTCGEFAGCEQSTSDYPTFMWKQWNSNLQLIHCNFNGDNPDERDKFEEYAKKQQASLIMIDEATAVQQFDMFTFWFMRNRDDSGMIPQMILTFNPKHKHWTTQMLHDAGYLGEDWYLRKDMIGKVRYFYVNGDNPEGIVWGDTKQEVVDRVGLTLKPEDAEVGMTVYDYVKSFSVYTGTASGNRELVNATGGQSVANLHAVGGTQRKVVGEAYFGPIDNEEINVNRQMIHDLWRNPVNGDENMYATLDVSGGNTDSDNCPMCIFKGNQLIAIKTFRGDPKELVSWIDNNLRQYNVPVANFAFDATGIGNYLRAYTSGVPLTANRRPIQELDKEGNPVNLDAYFNLRSQLLSRLEVMLQKGELSFAIPEDMTIPYGKKGEMRRVKDILFDEMNVLIFEMRNGKRYARSKDEYKAKFKSSPDLMDTIMLFMYFFLDAKPKKQPSPQVADDAYDEVFSPHPLSGWGNYNYW
ncbi:hypothetical protein [Muribaculum intestinale]|uniref:hypothetical protein n=1 Tax=Muribaculum intestinale TaxID=1796646 RepID=UPI0025B40D99|nr:hypothetical protein [Muribaculum intestinale]